jgi:AcrR family transcriptional regulator
MSRPPPNLSERRTEFTRALVLDAAIGLLESGELTMRAVAKQVGMAERSVFRYFATRDELLDAVADEARRRIASPPPPKTIEEIASFPRLLYASFEANERLVVAGLRSEIFDRMRQAAARTRWAAVRRLLDDSTPNATAEERKLHGANVCHWLGASTWHLYRASLRLTPEETVACAELGIRLSLEALGIDPGARGLTSARGRTRAPRSTAALR